MTIGFPAYYKRSIKRQSERAVASAAVVGTFESLGWKYEAFGDDLYEVTFSMNGYSWGEKLTVELVNGSDDIVVKSQCSFPFQMVDWGKNKKNVYEFLTLFPAREVRETKFNRDFTPELAGMVQSPLEKLFLEDDLTTKTQNEK